jgi:hypothetical protein
VRSSFLVNEYSRLVNKLKNADWFGIYWAFFIVFLPLYHPKLNVSMSSRDYKDGLFYLLAAFSLVVFRNKFSPPTYIAAFLFGFVFIRNVPDSIAFFHTLGIILSIGLIGQFAYYWRDCKKYIYHGFLIAATTQILWVCSHKIGFEPSNLWNIRGAIGGGALPVVGSLDNSMVTAAYLAPIVPLLLFFQAAVAVPLLACLAFCFVLLKSAIGIFGVFIAFLYIICHLLFNRLREFLFIAIATPFMVMIIAPFFPFLSDSTRYGAWTDAIKNVGFTAFGNGLGWFFHNGRKIIDPKLLFFHEHNEFLSVYFATGAVGLIAFLVSISYVARKHAMEPIVAASFFATLAVSYGAFPLHISSSALTFIVACGALLSYSINKTEASFKQGDFYA